MLTQKIYSCPCDVTFGRLGVQPLFPQALKQLPQMSNMIFHRSGIDEYVIQEDQYKLVQEVLQEVIHKVHKLRRGVGDPKRDNQTLVEPVASFERCLWYVLLPHWHLPISQFQVDLAEDFRPSQAVEHLLRKGERITILDGLFI